MSERMTTTDSAGRAVLKNPRACGEGRITMPEFEGETAEVLEWLENIAKTYPQFKKISDKAQNLIVELERENSRLLNKEDESNE